MEAIVIGTISSVIGGILLATLGKWQGWWWRSKNPASVDLATRILKFLDGAEEKTTRIVYVTKQLGDSLVAYYKHKTPYKAEHKEEALTLIADLLKEVRPFSSELAAAHPELDNLKRAVTEYQKGLEWRAQIVNHLCHPPNLPAMDPGHVRDQLLSVNVLPHDLLNAAKGEAAIFLRGHGINWFKRREHLQRIRRKQYALYMEAVAKDYRSILRQTSLHKARK